MADRQPGGNKGVGGDDDFVTSSDAVGFERDFQGIQTIAHGHAMLGSHIRGEFRLEGLRFSAHQIPPGIHDPMVGKIHLLLEFEIGWFEF